MSVKIEDGNDFWSTEGGLAGVDARSLKVGDKFTEILDLREAAGRCFLADGRGFCSDKRSSGSKNKLYRCEGAIYDASLKDKTKRNRTSGCQALVRACRQQKTGEWNITAINLIHTNCLVPEKKPDARVILVKATTEVIESNSASAEAQGEPPQGQSSSGNICTLEATTKRSRSCDARDESLREAEDTYTRLADYLKRLKVFSGESVTDCQFNKYGHFERCFMMLGAAAFFATQGVQKVFSIEAAHLTGHWNGVMLTLSFKNANSEILHVAVAVCQKEDADAYKYLLSKAMEFDDLREVLNNGAYTCFSDGLRGSDVALAEVCPLTEDRRCMHHILKAIPALGEIGTMTASVASIAPTESTFLQHMEKLKEIELPSWRELNAKPHELWTNYADRGNRTWNQSKSIMSEGVDKVVDDESMAKPVLYLLMDIVLKTASTISRASQQNGENTDLTPFAQKTYDEELKWSQGLDVSPCTQETYFVFTPGKLHLGSRVTYGCEISSFLRDVSCTCRFYERFGIPCRHLIATARYTRDSSEGLDLVNRGFRLGHYRDATENRRFVIVPPVYCELENNSAHRAPVRVDDQTPRPSKKGKGAAKR